MIERISEINSEFDIVDSIKVQTEKRKKLAKINVDTETPTRQFCFMDTRQKKKVRLSHLRQKCEKTKEEKIKYPDDEFYEDLFT